MDQLRSTLLAKVGPLPAYAWALIVIGAYLAYSYFTHTGFFGAKNAASADTGGGLASGYGDPFPGGLSGGGNGSTGTLGDNVYNPTPNPYTGISDYSYTPASYDLSAGAPVVPVGSTVLSTPISSPSYATSPAASGVVAVGGYLQQAAARLVSALPSIGSAPAPALGPATVSKSGRSL